MRTAIATDEPDEPAVVRAQIILEFCRVHTGQPLTKMQIALALGRMPGRAFDTDLAHARHLALDSGEELTNCRFDRAKDAYVLFHLYPDAENNKAQPPLQLANRNLRTRIRNVGRHGAWLAKYGKAEEDRNYGQMATLTAEAAEANLKLTEFFERTMREHR